MQPESQWHRIVVEFTADAVIPVPEFKGVTIAQPTDGNPALSKCLGVICRYDVFLARDVLTWGQDIALIPRHRWAPDLWCVGVLRGENGQGQ